MTMHWMQFGGTPYVLGSQRFEQAVKVTDIANALAKINRFTGHTWEPYSVAKHSVFVSELLDVDPLTALYGLAHDAHEAVISDQNSPYKWTVRDLLTKHFGPEAAELVKGIEDAADEACHIAMGLEWPVPEEIAKLVKRADIVAAATEQRDLMPSCYRDWAIPVQPHYRRVEATEDWTKDTEAFIARWETLAKHLFGVTKMERLKW
jgi:5'-deoxynucleotidase YfbR-like HD superfamily hydrolase